MGSTRLASLAVVILTEKGSWNKAGAGGSDRPLLHSAGGIEQLWSRFQIASSVCSRVNELSESLQAFLQWVREGARAVPELLDRLSKCSIYAFLTMRFVCLVRGM